MGSSRSCGAPSTCVLYRAQHLPYILSVSPGPRGLLKLRLLCPCPREKQVGGRDPKVLAEWAPFQEFSRKHLPVTPACISLATPLAREAGKQGWMAGPRWSPLHPRASVSKQGGRRRLVRQLAIPATAHMPKILILEEVVKKRTR